MRSDVNGQVKSAMKAHHDLLVAVGQEMIREQALEYFGIEDDSSKPLKMSLKTVQERNVQTTNMTTWRRWF